MARVTDRKDWFDLWFRDKQSMLALMVENLADDLRAGYCYCGVSATRQRAEIERYALEMDDQITVLFRKTYEERNRWCFYDMKRRGAVE